jgi:hypothetical protein
MKEAIGRAWRAAMEGRRRRRLISISAAAAAGVAAVGWAAFAPIPAGPREAVFVIPRGTAARIAAGEAVAAFPRRMRFTIGVRDLLVLRNEDDQPQSFGPVSLAPGQTYRVPFSAPATFDFACSAHDEGQLTIVVEREPVPGWLRLRWRVVSLLGG